MTDINSDTAAVLGAEDKGVAAVQDEQSMRLSHIEELLQQQLIQNVKMRRASGVRTVALVVMAAVLVVTIVVAGTSLHGIVADIPQLIADVDGMVLQAGDDLNEALNTLEDIDFIGINKVIGDVGAVDFDALNTSLQGLEEAVANFRAFTELLRNPFGL